jgi:TatD DNase family protein
MYIDSHCHLTDPRFDGEVDAVLDRAAAAGVVGVITIASDVADARAALVLAASRPGVWTTAGVHPHAAAASRPVPVAALRELAVRPECVALGEMGLDYHYDTSPRPVQRRVFAAQLELAAELGMPAVVHSRSADDDTLAAIREAGRDVRGVLHCFTGGHDLLAAALEAGWYISFTGLVTFRGFAGDSLVRAVAPDRLMIETDSPYLAPVPHRGRRNEPAYVTEVAAALARSRGVDVTVLATETTAAARSFYALDEAERLDVSSH